MMPPHLLEMPHRDAFERKASPRQNMIWVTRGSFRMGSDRHYPEEAPSHRVSVDGFWIDREVTSVGRSAKAPPKLAWRDAGKLAEPGGEVRLVTESHGGANFPERPISRS
jgi:Sulfatase-modifying factor enzyme 1